MFTFVEEKKYGKAIGIYEIRNVISNLVYIGQTHQGFKKRFFYHRWLLRTNQHDNKWLQASYNKYGEDAFVFKVLIVTDDPSELDNLEIKEITRARQEERCCNMANGGEGAKGVPLSEENKRKLAELNRKLNTGKKASDETKAKMSAIRKGIKRPAEVVDRMLETKAKQMLAGKRDKRQKLTPEQVVKIKIDLMNNISWSDLSKEFNVSFSNINAIHSNRSWKFVHVDGWEEYCETHKNNVHARQSRSAN